MFFLKDESRGLRKENIIFVENFLDPITKSEILKKKFKIKKFYVQDSKFKVSKAIELCNVINARFLNNIQNFYNIKYHKKISIKILNILIGKWSYSYISNFLYKYQLLKLIKKK